MISRSLRGLLFVLACLATLLLVAALVVRCTVRDGIDGIHLLYFATPWPVMAGVAAVCAMCWHRRGNRFTAAWLVVLSLAGVVSWLANDWQWRTATKARGELRVVHWNVDRPDWRQVWTFAWLAEQNADIIAIAEREPKKRDMAARWQTAFPDYRQIPQKGETLLLVRGEVLSVKKEMRLDGSFATAIRVRVKGRELTVLQLDIRSTPSLSREKPLRELVSIVHQHRNEDLLLLGDFNTPLDSVYVAPLREQLTNAFEAVGTGCAATWPMPVPVLSLDQVWSSARLRPVRCEHVGLWQSDHRAVVAEFEWVTR